jgi:hypothetical protein
MSDRCKFVVSLFSMLGVIAAWAVLILCCMAPGYPALGMTMGGAVVILAAWMYYIARNNL